MSFATEKASLLAILKENECSAAKDVYANMNAYADIPGIYFKYGNAFDGDNPYLNTLAVIFDDPSIVAEGIYYNKVAAGVVNPKIVLKSTYTTITVNLSGNYGDIEIGGASIITEIIITNNTLVGTLTIAGGSVVQKLTIDPGSCIESLIVKSENGQDSTLNKIVGSCVKNLGVSGDSDFGGFDCDYTLL